MTRRVCSTLSSMVDSESFTSSRALAKNKTFTSVLADMKTAWRLEKHKSGENFTGCGVTVYMCVYEQNKF